MMSAPNRFPGLNPMAKELSKVTGKKSESLAETMRHNVRHLLEGIPEDDLLNIFLEEE